MPILYQNNKPRIMQTYKEVTQEQLDAMRRHHKKYQYTNEEAAEVFNLVRTFVDPHQGACMSCHTNLRDAKTKLNGFFVNHEQLIVDNLLAIRQVEAYASTETSTEKLCACGNVIEDKRFKSCEACRQK